MSGLGAYEVRLKTSAEKEFDRLPGAVAARVVKAMLSLESQPRRPGCKKLHGRDAYRFRVGDYRILYTIDDPARTVEVVAIAHRKDAYR
jgi:mRNA interferase RelE/StbE